MLGGWQSVSEVPQVASSSSRLASTYISSGTLGVPRESRESKPQCTFQSSVCIVCYCPGHGDKPSDTEEEYLMICIQAGDYISICKQPAIGIDPQRQYCWVIGQIQM